MMAFVLKSTLKAQQRLRALEGILMDCIIMKKDCTIAVTLLNHIEENKKKLDAGEVIGSIVLELYCEFIKATSRASDIGATNRQILQRQS